MYCVCGVVMCLQVVIILINLAMYLLVGSVGIYLEVGHSMRFSAFLK